VAFLSMLSWRGMNVSRVLLLAITNSPICSIHTHYTILETPQDVYWGCDIVEHPGPQWTACNHCPLSLSATRVATHWLKQVTDRYEYAVHIIIIIKALCKLGNNALLLCIALIWCLSKLPSPCSNISFPILHVCFTAHSWLPQGTILVNNYNSGDKCNCQNNKCFFAV